VLILLFLIAAWAGAQNALAGGGAFLTLPALMLSGLDARLANITSCLALFPAQVSSGWVGRRDVRGVGRLGFRALAAISLAGGALGAGLLVVTPSDFFERLVPWLVLAATALFAYGSFFRRSPAAEARLAPAAVAVIQFAIAVYGGYFGGGIGFLMLAALTAAGLAVRAAGATKNALAAVMNASAIVVFAFTPDLPYERAAVMAAGSVVGGWGGAMLLRRIDERVIRGFVVVLGLALTVGLFLR